MPPESARRTGASISDCGRSRQRATSPNRYRFKLGKGTIQKTGESPDKETFDKYSFAPRHIA